MRKRKAIFALMLVLFIDGLGQGIIFPILTQTLTDIHSTILLHHASQSLRDTWYGILVGAYYVMWFLGAIVLGEWSDSVGRKKALLFCLFLAALSFVLSAVAFEIGSLEILLLSRLLGGITCGDQAIAQASVVDLCEPEKKPICLGWVMFSITLGLIVGPLIAASLQNHEWVSWFNIKTPFYFSGLLAIINFILVSLFFEETRAIKQAIKPQWTKAIHIFIQAFHYAPVRRLLTAYIFIQLGWTMFYIFTPNFIQQKYQVSTLNIGGFMALIGFCIGMGLGILPRFFQKYSYHKITRVGYITIALAYLVFIFSHQILLLWIAVIPATALVGLAFANVSSLFSEKVNVDRQGWIMGVVGSVGALTAAINSFSLNFLSSFGLQGPYVYAFITTVLGLIILK